MARPRKLNATKQGHRTKEELEHQELKENGLSQFPLLEQLPIAELDYDRIKRYCQLVSLTDEAYRHIMQHGTVNEEGTKRTPQYFTYMDGLKELKSICGQLGMTIDSRMKLVVPTPDEQKQSVYDKFGVDEDD